jgi:hypothetical protein
MIAILTIFSVIFAKDIGYLIRGATTWLAEIFKTRFSKFELFLITSIIFVWSFTLIGSLGPLLGMDALSYHMRDPKLFIEAHKITQIPYTRDSLWPFLMEMLFTLGLILKGAILSKLFHFGFGIFSIIGVYVLCKRQQARRESLFASAVFALSPAIFTVTTYAYTELASIFYTIAVFYLFFVWLKGEDNRYFYLSGIFCGFLMGIKITSAPAVLILTTLYLFNLMRKKEPIKNILSSVVIFVALMLATCGIWYMRSWIITGNPIFPFAAYIFGYGYPEENLRYHLIAGIGLSLWSYLRMLWPLTHYPDIFGGENIGPVYLIFLPALIFIKRPSRFVRYIIFIAITLYTAWFFTFQYTRFLSSTLPFLSILVSYVFFNICDKDKVIFTLSKAVIIFIFIYCVLLSVYHNIDKLPVALGFESRRDYLLRYERSYAMAEYVNKNLPKDSKILVLGEPRLYYFNRKIGMVTSAKLNMRYDKNARYGGSFDEYLRSEGFDYLLYFNDDNAVRDPKVWPEPDQVMMGDEKVLIQETRFDYRDEHCLYKLYKIKRGISRKS